MPLPGPDPRALPRYRHNPYRPPSSWPPLVFIGLFLFTFGGAVAAIGSAVALLGW